MCRNTALRARGEKGFRSEYLITDLVGILSEFEIRLTQLERRRNDE